jgi:cytochrome c peroxidase
LNNGGALESQVLGPPLSTAEMAHAGRDWNDVAARMAASKPLALAPTVPAALSTWINGRTYPELFQEAFGTSQITAVRIAQAIATYERTLIPDRAPIDAFLAGNQNALTDVEKRGLAVFDGIGRCSLCHPAPLFGKDEYFHLGVRPWFEDLGRAELTRRVEDAGAFRAVSIRNAALQNRITYYTTLSGARAACVGMKHLTELKPYDIQSLHESLPA